MKYLFFFAVAFLFCCKLNAQYTVRYIDSIVSTKHLRKVKVDYIFVGKRGAGTGFNYYRKTRKMFSIIIEDNKPRLSDTSAIVTGYFFIDDKLVKIRPRIFFRNKKKFFSEDIYFDSDKVQAVKNGTVYSEQEIGEMVTKAYALLADGNARIQQKFINQ